MRQHRQGAPVSDAQHGDDLATYRTKPPEHSEGAAPRTARERRRVEHSATQLNPAASMPRNSFFRSAISSRNRPASSNCNSLAAFII